MYVGTLASAFEEAFAGVTPRISLYPDPEARPASIRVILDASHGNPSILCRARSSGARVRFIDAVVSAIPADVMKLLDFEFLFPREG
jgi:hypothetical protein